MNAKSTSKAAPAKSAAKKTAPVEKLHVDKEAAAAAKYRGAREAWLEELVKWDGKGVQAFCAHVKENPPSTPKTGKYAGQCEPPMGWVKFFIRQQILTISK